MGDGELALGADTLDGGNKRAGCTGGHCSSAVQPRRAGAIKSLGERHSESETRRVLH